jgi:CheY-like chemotaxis protein
MARRIENVILVSSTYDTFILQEDGQLSALVLAEFLELNLHHTTGVVHVPSGAEAIELAKNDSRFNLIVSAVHAGDMNAVDLAQAAREAGLEIPVVLLAFDGGQLAEFMAGHDLSPLERVFLWQGDSRILLAIIKYMEDKLNAPFDCGVAGIQVILLVEDNIRFYSSFLPIVYSEIIRHTQTLIGEGVNLAHKILRMRARPKILLCGTFEEAWERFQTYEDNVLGVISDVEFPQDGRLDPEAGLAFARLVKDAWPDIPVILQSGHPESRGLADAVEARFLLKDSPTLLTDLRRFIIDDFLFGDFIFRMPDGAPVGRARDLRELIDLLHTVPVESITYHAAHNHFSRWLKARTEFHLAHHLRPTKPSDYSTPEDERRYLIDQIEIYRREQARGSVADFDPTTFDVSTSFARIGEGSLGGKARALAFVRHLLRDFEVSDEFPGVEVAVPPAVVLATSVFDDFLEDNALREFALASRDDAAIEERFLRGSLRPDTIEALAAFLALAHYPLAVRSSSLLEDSQYQPLAGVYHTYMLPNNHDQHAVRLEQLTRAVKRVLASAFLTYAKNYFAFTPYRLEEEKMAVIVQRLVGQAHGARFYPDLAGVVRSRNLYPLPPAKAEDGVATVALGLGRTVVEGGRALSFSPRHPTRPFHFSTPAEMLANSQREFVALELEAGSDEATEARYPLQAAEADGTLAALASTYSRENDAVYEGLSREGVRLVSFAPLLRRRLFPLPATLSRLTELGRWGMTTEIEIEFAVDLSGPPARLREFAFLQMRPLALSRETAEVSLDEADSEDSLCFSTSVLGDGTIDHIRDVVAVDEGRFDRSRTQEVAAEIARLNATLVAEGVPYILVGMGRWGSADPWLGIPVTWEQISGARVMVECDFQDMAVTPSQGSHFFQNLTSFRVGYFTVNEQAGEGWFDWSWLATQPVHRSGPHVRHFRFALPLVVKIDARRQRGAILKPGVGEERRGERP